VFITVPSIVACVTVAPGIPAESGLVTVPESVPSVSAGTHDILLFISSLMEFRAVFSLFYPCSRHPQSPQNWSYCLRCYRLHKIRQILLFVSARCNGNISAVHVYPSFSFSKYRPKTK